ncbi:hypothetical protein IW140_004733 [Coemansia sp. RSA 1813]|nr:hypothetical protein EV178_004062 [Coemansia sp. RSA 1646]KAJ1770420.1 hypothetical protein LPJ74_003227 [Coemansia sp. RSA 1843]KAJ2088236.1 hypothetical protein IW138_004408 [Coemansia sp. RSA 986]KAJ2215722.1 hypothetical protein EV179_001946 [Coemansia sp. RSA 487]KAJ2566942.1 hypothetical protein IW140_004733 [Coemansia sp. RSA 1813]
MVRHSKNNTASGVFTYAERQMVDYGTKTKRLGKDSKRPFDSCHMCLNTSRMPMVCTEGHIFCKECVMANILEQKQDIQRLQKEFKEFKKREKRKLDEKRARMDELEVKKYIKSEAGLSETGGKRKDDSEQSISLQEPTKRVRLLEDKSSELSSPSSSSVFARGKERALQRTHDTQSNDEDNKRPSSFWLPSQAPEAKETLKDPSQLSVQCKASNDPHSLKLKNLTAVQFRTSSKGEKLCPSCDKPLLNSSKIDILRPCGHAICHRCVSNFVLPAKECFVCQKKVSSEAEDVIRLGSDGTGFAGGGGQMVASRYDSALQA